MSDPGGILNFGKHQVRTVQIDEILWFALPDLCDAIGWDSDWIAIRAQKDIPAFAWRGWMEAIDPDIPGEPREIKILSPVGVWYFTHIGDPARGQHLAAWAKREAKRICPRSPMGDPRNSLTLLSHGELPPYPMKYSGRRSEWLDLRDSNEYLEAKYGVGSQRFGLRSLA